MRAPLILQSSFVGGSSFQMALPSSLLVPGAPVPASTAPINGTCPAQAVKQDAMQSGPQAGRLPIAQSPLAGHTRSTAYLPGQHLPGDALLQHKQNAGQRRPV